MTYKSDDRIEEEIINDLTRIIESPDMKIQDLTLESIKKRENNVDNDRLENILDKLEREGKLIVKPSRIKLYVPENLENNEKIKSLSLGNQIDNFLRYYFLGLILLALLVSFSSYVDNYIRSSFVKIQDAPNLIANGLLLSFVIPLIIGYTSLQIYYKVNILLNRHVNKNAILTILVTTLIILLFYFVLTHYLKQQVQSYWIIGSIIGGFTVGSVIYNYVLKNR